MEPRDTDTSAADQLWRRHTQDEAEARAVQQESAGQDHSPLPGPPPYGNAQVNLIAAEIVLRERERCARLVEGWPVDPTADAGAMLRDIADRIRHPSS